MRDVSTSTITSFRVKEKTRRPSYRRFWIGMAFASPWIIGFVFLTLIPFVESFYYSLTSYDVFQAPQWVGLQNYIKIFHDSNFYISLRNTAYMAFIAVPINLGLSFLIALLLNKKVKGIAIYRTIYYLPTVIPGIATFMLWSWILDPQYGVLDEVLRAVHLPDPAWLTDPHFTKPTLILMGLWGAGGGSLIILLPSKEYHRSIMKLLL